VQGEGKRETVIPECFITFLNSPGMRVTVRRLAPYVKIHETFIAFFDESKQNAAITTRHFAQET